MVVVILSTVNKDKRGEGGSANRDLATWPCEYSKAPNPPSLLGLTTIGALIDCAPVFG